MVPEESSKGSRKDRSKTEDEDEETEVEESVPVPPTKNILPPSVPSNLLLSKHAQVDPSPMKSHGEPDAKKERPHPKEEEADRVKWLDDGEERVPMKRHETPPPKTPPPHSPPRAPSTHPLTKSYTAAPEESKRTQDVRPPAQKATTEKPDTKPSPPIPIIDKAGARSPVAPKPATTPKTASQQTEKKGIGAMAIPGVVVTNLKECPNCGGFINIGVSKMCYSCGYLWSG